jgi:2-amino-4-hydroxy-6-hydroxymethyldihydropteridine diphosphokinase
VAVVHIGIGSNIGDRKANCRNAIERLKGRGINIKKISSMYETEPWGIKDQPKFINMAIEAETGLPPERLLESLKLIEKEMGRTEPCPTKSKWGPRIIDLDILFYGDKVINMERLEIPHPLLHEREFVLVPLSEIAPEKLHPTLKKTVRELREELSA